MITLNNLASKQFDGLRRGRYHLVALEMADRELLEECALHILSHIAPAAWRVVTLAVERPQERDEAAGLVSGRVALFGAPAVLDDIKAKLNGMHRRAGWLRVGSPTDGTPDEVILS